MAGGGEAGEGEKNLLLHYRRQSWWILKPLNKELGAMSDWKKQMGDQASGHQRHLETVAHSQSKYPLHRPLCPCSKGCMGMLSPADAVLVCGAPANLPPPPHTPSSGTSSSWHSPMALAPRSGRVSSQVFWGAQRVMGSASVSSPSLCHCIPAPEAKFCFLHSPLVSAVDREIPDLSCPGQRGRDLLLGSVSVF